jgi:hypothetical protein
VWLQVSKREARKLGLKKATTLASKAVTCAGNDKVTVTLPAGAWS